MIWRFIFDLLSVMAEAEKRGAKFYSGRYRF